MIMEFIDALPGWSISILTFLLLYIMVNIMFVIKGTFIAKKSLRIRGNKSAG